MLVLPLDGVLVQRLTDFSGDEIDAAISPDGNFTAFLSDRDGTFDAWISPTGSGRFNNMTKGRFPAVYPGPIRSVGFSDDNSQLWFLEQVSVRPQRLRAWLTPVVPAEHRVFLESGLHPAWSPDRTRLARVATRPAWVCPWQQQCTSASRQNPFARPRRTP